VIVPISDVYRHSGLGWLIWLTFEGLALTIVWRLIRGGRIHPGRHGREAAEAGQDAPGEAAHDQFEKCERALDQAYTIARTAAERNLPIPTFAN
jgi:hypothetical protein